MIFYQFSGKRIFSPNREAKKRYEEKNSNHKNPKEVEQSDKSGED
jgi:hypothetical protein